MKKTKDKQVSVRLIKNKMQEMYLDSKEKLMVFARSAYAEELDETVKTIIYTLKTEKPEYYFYEACAWYSKEFDVPLTDIITEMKNENRTM